MARLDVTIAHEWVVHCSFSVWIADEGNGKFRQAPEQVTHAVPALWTQKFPHPEEPLLGLCLPRRKSPQLYVILLWLFGFS